MGSIFAVTLILASSIAFSCTSFLDTKNGRSVVGKNLDWDYGHGLIVVNKRNVQRRALPDETGTDAPLLWTSKYGSVTFNQVGRGFPYGGMNEKGLTIEILWLEKTEYPDTTPGVQTVNELQWIQTMLDRAATIDDMVQLAKEFQLKSRFAKVHYFVCEAQGNCATFEFLNKELVVTKMGGKDVKVLTNDPYKIDRDLIPDYNPFGGTKVIPNDGYSLPRFLKIARLLKEADTVTPLVDEAFKMLDEAQVDRTKWSIVYDPANSKIYFKTKDHPRIKQVTFSTFSWSCHRPVQMIDINTAFNQDVSTHFEDYTDSLNKKMVGKTAFISSENFPGIEKAPSEENCTGP